MEGSVRIAALDSGMEAEALRCVLDAAGVPHILRSFHDSAYVGIFQQQKGWGCVMGAEADRARIESILGELRTWAEERASSPD